MVGGLKSQSDDHCQVERVAMMRRGREGCGAGGGGEREGDNPKLPALNWTMGTNTYFNSG